MDVNKIIATLAMVGANLPAYKALYDQVVTLFSEDDQTKLQEAYAEAIKASDAAHSDAQNL